MNIRELINEGSSLSANINKSNKLAKQQDFFVWTEKVKRYLNQTVPGDMVISTFEKEIKMFNINHCTQEGFGRIIAILEAFEQLPQKTMATGNTNVNNENSINITNTLSQHQNQLQNTTSPLFIFSDAIKDELKGRELKEIRKILQSKEDKQEDRDKKLIAKYKEIGPDTMAKILANITKNPELLPSFE